MAGLIKTILVLAHGSAPPNLHASAVNPRINLESLPAVLPEAGMPSRLSRQSCTGRQQDKHQREQRQQAVGLDGECQSRSTGSEEFLGGVSSFGFGGTNAHVILEGKAGAFGPVPLAERMDCTAGVAFLFSGQGEQYPGMGRGLYESYEEFRAVMDTCDEELEGVLPRRLLSVLYGSDEDAGVFVLDSGVQYILCCAHPFSAGTVVWSIVWSMIGQR